MMGKVLLELLRFGLTVGVAIFIIYIIEPWGHRPNVSILGVLPIHLLELSERDSAYKYSRHKFALIFKVHNSSPSAAIIHMAMIEGCVKMDRVPTAAEFNLPPEKRVSFDGKNINFGYDRHKQTVQHIRTSGHFRDTPASIAVPAYGTEYLGVLFSASSRAYVEFTGSVSLRGECSEIKVSNTRPSIEQILEMGLRYPKSLRSEVLGGQLTISLIAGDNQITVDPEMINQKVYSLRWKRWPELRLAQMYENPDSDFPPVSHFD